MRVIQPVVDRTYDPNPQGSATTTVTMAAALPFQRRVVVSRYGSQPVSVAGLGSAETDAATAQMNADASSYSTSLQSTPAQPVSSSSTSSLLAEAAMGLTKAASTVVQGAATRVANRLTGQRPAQPTGAGFSVGAGGPSWVLIGGVAAVAGLGLWFMMRKPTPARASYRRRR